MQSVLAKISVCRTHVLGGRKFQCNDCGETSTRYNSCGDRHCPQCSGSKRFDFNEKASKLLLPDVEPQVAYYQVVFTLPRELSELALANQHAMADLLMGAAWKCLSKSIHHEQGYDPAAMAVLHTWNQKLEPHWHAHLLVPGEGPATDVQEITEPSEGRCSIERNAGWKIAKAPPAAKNSDGHYLVNVAKLKCTFRKRAIARLQWLRKQGQIRFGGKYESLRHDEHWERFIEKLESKTWNVFIQPPPTKTSNAREVVNYLTRYLTGGPISEPRIVAANAQEVTFMAREGTRVGGERKQVLITLSLQQFLRRWCLHILPRQLTKTRYFGGWSCTRRKQYLASCKSLLEQAGRRSSPLVNEAEDEEQENDDTLLPAATPCPHCGSEWLTLLSETPKPSWRDLFWYASADCPTWYANVLRQEQIRWPAACCDAYANDNQPESIESANRNAANTAPNPNPAIQLEIFDLTPISSYPTISF